MTPADFAESNVVFAKDQKEYLPLPAIVHPHDPRGSTTFSWRLTWRERFLLLVRGRLWHTVLTFRAPLQPQLLSVDKPEFKLASFATPEAVQGGEAEAFYPMPEHWRVEVSVLGEQVVAIEPGCLSGRELSDDDRNLIRGCAEHLWAFVGPTTPHSSGQQGEGA